MGESDSLPVQVPCPPPYPSVHDQSEEASSVNKLDAIVTFSVKKPHAFRTRQQ